MKKKLFCVVSLLLAALFVLTACAPASPKAPAETPAPAQEEEKTTQTEAPQTTSADYEGKLVWYYPFPHPFGEGCKAGIDAYVKDTGIPIKVMIGPDFTQDSENEKIEALQAQGYQHFGIFGVDGAGSNGLYQQLTDAGCTVNNLGWDSIQPTPASHLISTNIPKSAEIGAEKLCEIMDYKGTIMVCYGPIVDTTFPARQKAVNDVIAKYPDMKIATELTDLVTPDDTVIKFADGLSAYQDKIDGILAVGASGGAICNILEESYAKGAKRLSTVLIDIDDSVTKAIKTDVIDGTVVQNEYGIGYISGEVLKLQADGYKPAAGQYHIDTGVVFVSKENIDTYQEDLKSVTKDILATLATKYMTK